MKQMNVTEKRIGENAFYIKPFPAFTAANLSGELASILAPVLSSLAPLFGDGGGDVMDMDIDNRNISVEGEATENEVRLLSYDLANEIFCGDIDEMYILCFEVIKLNFGGFFKKLGTQSGSLKDFVQKKIPSTKSTESSTLTDSAN